MITEFDVTYITKEYLLANNWQIIAYNPPGSQGTFTIPNPLKDINYRGQTGSLSPDIVAIKELDGKNIFLIVEAKPKFNEKDLKKMMIMFESEERKKVFMLIVEKHCEANDININRSLEKIIYFAKAHSGKTEERKEVVSFIISENIKWENKLINPKESIYEKFTIKEYNLPPNYFLKINT